MVDTMTSAARPSRLRAVRAGATLVGLALFAAAAGAAAQTPPHQRVGLWTSDMQMQGRAISTKTCVDAASNARSDLLSRGGGSTYCKRTGLVHNLDGSWTSTSTCAFPGGKVTNNRMDVSGDFNSKIAMKMTDVATGLSTMSLTMTWSGACPEGMRGGDVMIGGRVIHTMDPAGR